MSHLRVILIIPLLLALAACAGASTDVPETPLAPTATEQATAPQPTAESTAAATEELPAQTEAPPEPALSFEPATYRDEANGFEFDYPADWQVSDQGVLGDRGSQALLVSNGEPRLAITVYLWDPKNDLDAYVDHRKQAWSGSGLTILLEEPLVLEGGQRAVRFVVQTAEGEQAFFFFTTAGERYLELSGTGDPALLAEIAQTVRVLEGESQAGAPSELDCSSPAEGSADWVACNVIDGLRSRNLSALHSFMADPFTIGYWGSEGRTASPPEITAELAEHRLPADAASSLTFTTDRSLFPPLAGQPPETLFGPGLNVSKLIYSEGWGPDGAGSALLYIVQNESGEFTWHAMAYSDRHFDY
jgi:hypothetical protein